MNFNGGGDGTFMDKLQAPLIPNGINQDHFRGDFSMEDSPSYEVLSRHNLLTTKYRVSSEQDLQLIGPNSTRWKNVLSTMLYGPFSCCILNNFEVSSGCVRTGADGRGNFLMFGPGVHQIVDPFYSIGRYDINFARENVLIGDRNIVTVDQGFIGYCTERGQPVLLPPGMHQWQSQTLKFRSLIDLNEPVIRLGPWTLLTIDQGYMAVTQDNGKQVILDGGSVYLLTHRNWKFEKFVSIKIQTNELKRIEAASADNVIMLVDATVLWRIRDVETAVRMAAETMTPDGSKATGDILKSRNDVLKQAEASLAFFIGTINFSDSMAAAAFNQRAKSESQQQPADTSFVAAVNVQAVEETKDDDANLPTQNIAEQEVFNLYNNEKLRDAVAHANEITSSYGVEVISINIISAIPKDEQLQASLAKGAVAAAEAQMMETSAQGKGRAIEIEAAAKAKQTMILAQADADAAVLRAKGAKDAADLLAENKVSVELAKIERTGQAIAGKGNHASFFFGSNPDQFAKLLSNGSVIHGPFAEDSVK